jgi:hypothetical protein
LECPQWLLFFLHQFLSIFLQLLCRDHPSSWDTMRLLTLGAAALLAVQAAGASVSHKLNGFTITEHPDPTKRELLQKYVCSLSFTNGGC